MQARRRSGLRKVHLVLDAVVVAASVLLAFGLHVSLQQEVSFLKETPRFNEFATLTALTLPLWLVLVAALGLHRSFERKSSRSELFVDLIKFHLLGLLGVTALLFATQDVINRSLVAMFLSCSFVLMYLVRAAIGRWIRYQHEHGHGRRSILLVGVPGDRMNTFVEHAARDELPPTLVGYLHNESPRTPGELEHLGQLHDLAGLLHDHAVDQVVFLPPYHRPEDVHDALEACEEVGVHASFAVDMVQLARAVPRIEFSYEHPFITFDVSPKRAEALAIKHGFDFVAALLGVIVISPILLLTSLAIVVTMGRPVFFSQERAGLYGRKFRMIKFRTMVKGAEAKKEELRDQNEMSGPVFKVTDDPRITRLGNILRKTSIDELPQLFNVIAGTMSLVGPRPLPSAEQKQIRGWQRRRLSVKPGITGLWQVSGRSNIDFSEWMALDLRYVDEWSLWFDLWIIVKTVPALLSTRGAR